MSNPGRRMFSIFYFLMMIVAIGAAGLSWAGDPRPGLIGFYTSVTESECNIELGLLDENKAEIRQTCRTEGKRPPKDVEVVKDAIWFVKEGKVILSYQDTEDSLEFVRELPYEDFGEKGTGPGLRLVGPLNSKSRLAGYGNLWKRPLPQER